MMLSYRLKGWWNSAYSRISLNRCTAGFFIFSFVYCFIAGILQSLLYSVDFEYSSLVSSLVQAARIPPGNITYLEGPRGHLTLRMCNDIPHGQPLYPCTTLFSSSADSPVYGTQKPVITEPAFHLRNWEKGLNITEVVDPLDASQVTALRVEMWDGSVVNLSERCVRILVYPSQILINFRREDISWLFLQFWLLATSFIAILNGSVPHTLAVLMTRALAAGWSMYAFWRGSYFRRNLQELIGDHGTPCSLDVFSDFWAIRRGYETADLVLNTTALVFFLYTSLSLLKIYNEQSFKCVGAPEHVLRIHKFFMAVLACLQMEAFVLVTGMALWIDVLVNTAIAQISEHTPIYKALFICTCVLLLPWIAMGWYSIRREMKKMMIIFLAIGFVITSGWSIMFYSIVYRWSFMQWPYLGCFTVASLLLLLSSMVLGVVCRMNFGNGLAQYLHAESTLASLNFAQDSFERRTSSRYSKDGKISWDPESSIYPVPTYHIKALSKFESTF